MQSLGNLEKRLKVIVIRASKSTSMSLRSGVCDATFAAYWIIKKRRCAQEAILPAASDEAPVAIK